MKKIFILLFLLFYFINIPAFGYYNYYNNSPNYNTQAEWQILYDNAVIYRNNGNYDAAISEFKKAIKLKPNYIDAYDGLAACYLGKKEYDRALSNINIAINLSPNNALLYDRRGIVKKVKKDYFGAFDDCSKAYEMDPKSEYKNDIDKIRSKIRNPKFLIKYFEEHYKDFPILLIILGVIIPLTSLYIEINEIFIKLKNTTCEKTQIQDKYEKIDKSQPLKKQFYIRHYDLNTLEKLYNILCNPNYSIDSVFWFILLILGAIIIFANNYFLKYFFDSETLVFLAVVFAYIIEKVFLKPYSVYNICKQNNIDEVVYRSYLLYKGVSEKIEKFKIEEKEKEEKIQRQKDEEERIRREEERQKQLAIERQKRSYWQTYWREKQKNGFEFERAVGELYGKMGYQYTVTKGTGDGGVDLILYKDGIKTIIQCKAHKHIIRDLNQIRALWGVREDFKAQKAIFIAYGGVTKGAKDFTKGKDYKILDVNDLINMSLKVYTEKV